MLFEHIFHIATPPWSLRIWLIMSSRWKTANPPAMKTDHGTSVKQQYSSSTSKAIPVLPPHQHKGHKRNPARVVTSFYFKGTFRPLTAPLRRVAIYILKRKNEAQQCHDHAKVNQQVSSWARKHEAKRIYSKPCDSFSSIQTTTTHNKSKSINSSQQTVNHQKKNPHPPPTPKMKPQYTHNPRTTERQVVH